MKHAWDQIGVFAREVVPNPKLRKRLLAVVGVFFVLQLYFVRELIAAELLFGLVFAVLLILVGIFYVVGAIGERAMDASQTGVRAMAESARRGYTKASPVLDSAAKRGTIFAEAAAKVITLYTRRGFHKLEGISKKPFRHPRSESAQ